MYRGIVADSNEPVIINTIIWGNEATTGSQINGTPVVAYSNIEGDNVWEGDGNLNLEPLFEDSLFNLSSSSPCVGNGIDSYPFDDETYKAPEFDFYGNDRPNEIDEFVDTGAIESAYERVPVGLASSDLGLPVRSELAQNYPNPFNPSTMITYQLPISNDVELTVYNNLGQKIATLVSENQSAGLQSVEWNASGFASGVYYYKIKAGEFRDVKKMILLR